MNLPAGDQMKAKNAMQGLPPCDPKDPKTVQGITCGFFVEKVVTVFNATLENNWTDGTPWGGQYGDTTIGDKLARFNAGGTYWVDIYRKRAWMDDEGPIPEDGYDGTKEACCGGFSSSSSPSSSSSKSSSSSSSSSTSSSSSRSSSLSGWSSSSSKPLGWSSNSSSSSSKSRSSLSSSSLSSSSSDSSSSSWVRECRECFCLRGKKFGNTYTNQITGQRDQAILVDLSSEYDDISGVYRYIPTINLFTNQEEPRWTNDKGWYAHLSDDGSKWVFIASPNSCLLYTSPSPRDRG